MPYKKILVMMVFLITASVIARHYLEISYSTAKADSAQSLKRSEESIREEMLTISRQLGVTCTECHDVQNFKNDDKKAYKIGLEHIKLVEVMRNHGMDGKKGPEATCYMCHRGKIRPDYKEPASNEKSKSAH